VLHRFPNKLEERVKSACSAQPIEAGLGAPPRSIGLRVKAETRRLPSSKATAIALGRASARFLQRPNA
jgi:hypothetical protein